MFRRELCKKFKFDYALKWYIHKPESVQENAMHKILWDHLIPARIPDLMIIKSRKPAILWILPSRRTTPWKSKKLKRETNTWSSPENKKLLNMLITMIPIVIGVLGTVLKGLERSLEEFEIREWSETFLTTALLRSTKILRRVLGALRRLAVTETTVKDHQLTIMLKTSDK